MEIYQIVLMVIGAITLVWLSYKALKGFVWCYVLNPVISNIYEYFMNIYC